MPNEFTEVADQLLTLEGETMRAIERKALKRVGEIVLTTMQFDCPEKTDAGGLLAEGELRESLKARVKVASDAAVVDGKSSRVLIGPVGETANIVAGWVVNGHVARRSKKKEGPPRFVPANPFVDRAYDECHEAAEAAYFESVTEDIEKALP